MQAKIDNRNQFVDIMRGIAMLLGCFGAYHDWMYR